jgi:hypothetical protein
MKKLSTSVLVAAWMLIAAPQAGANLILTVGGATTSDSETLTGLTLGNAITFEYMFSNVVWNTGTNFFGLNASVINPLLGAFPAGQFNANKNSNTAWLTGGIDTTLGAGTLHDLAFTLNRFATNGNSATVEIRNIAIDGRVVGVPEPGTLSLLGAGLVGLAWLRRRRAV